MDGVRGTATFSCFVPLKNANPEIVADIRTKSFDNVIFFLLELKEDFGQYENHNICSFAFKTNAFITLNINHALGFGFICEPVSGLPALSRITAGGGG